MISPELLEILACPRCDARPKLDYQDQALICPLCRHRYPIIDGIPHLLVENAIPPEDSTL